MNVEFINPFLDATLNVITTMAFIELKAGKPFIKKGEEPLGDITGVIGFVGDRLMGSMAIVFPKECALKIVSSMLGEEITEMNSDIIDAVGELTNMISGGAKRDLSEKGFAFEMAIPSMITGRQHTVYHKTKGHVLVIPFEMEEGIFYVEACFQEPNSR